MQPDVSVIITSYNTAGYITRAVDSALSQTGVSLEVVIVDDCSSDNSWQVIEGLADPRIKRFRPAQNGGPSVTRNLAIGMATGKWLAVLDSDDTFDAGRLERLLKRAETLNADIIVDNLAIYREADGASYPMFEAERLTAIPKLTLAEFIKGNQYFLDGFTLGYLKPVFSSAFLAQHQLSYDPDIRIGEDYFLLASALALGASCAVEPTVGYIYTVRKGSISHRLQPADVSRINACDNKLLARFKLDGVAQAAQAKRTRNLARALAFTQLVEAIKQRNAGGICKVIISQPSAVLGLWRPIAVRLERLKKKLVGSRG